MAIKIIQKQKIFSFILFFLFLLPLFSYASSQSNGNLKRCPKTIQEYNSGEYSQDMTGCNAWNCASVLSPELAYFKGPIPGDDSLPFALASCGDKEYAGSVPIDFYRQGSSPFKTNCWGSGYNKTTSNNPYPNINESSFKKVVFADAIEDVKITNVNSGQPACFSVPFDFSPNGRGNTICRGWCYHKITNIWTSNNSSTNSREISYDPYKETFWSWRDSSWLEPLWPQTISQGKLTETKVINQCDNGRHFKDGRCVECVTDSDCSVAKESKGTAKCLANLESKHTSCQRCENLTNTTGNEAVKKIVFVTNANNDTEREAIKNYIKSTLVPEFLNIEPFKYLYGGSNPKIKMALQFVSGQSDSQIGNIEYDLENEIYKNKDKLVDRIKNYTSGVCGQNDLVVFLDKTWPDSFNVLGLAFMGRDFIALNYNYARNRPNNPDSSLLNHELGHSLCDLGDEYPDNNISMGSNVSSFIENDGIFSCYDFDENNVPRPNCWPVVSNPVRPGYYRGGISTPTSVMQSSSIMKNKFNAISCASCLSKSGLSAYSRLKNNVKYCVGSTTPENYKIYEGVLPQEGTPPVLIAPTE